MNRVEASLAGHPLRWACAWILGWAVFSLFIPIDASYDILHYHLQDGWSAWHGRLTVDFAPAGMHTYFNPVTDAIMYALIANLPAGAITFLLAAIQASVLLLLYLLCRRVLASLGHDSRISALLIALAGFFSYSMVNLISSIRTDHWITAGFLGGLLLLLPADRRPVTWRRAALAAFLVGLTIGLKLTAVIHAAGIAAAIAIAVSGWRSRIAAAVAAAISGLAGILLTGGWWFYKLWSLTGNPVFPMANGFFHSPYAPPENFRDPRSLLRNIWEVLLFPVNGAYRNYNEYDTSALQDLPIGLLYIAFVLFGVVWFRSLRRPSAGPAVHFPRPLLVVLGSVVATLAVWFPLFAIGRYAMSVWMLSPLLFASALIAIWPAVTERARSLLWFGSVFAICAVAGFTVPLRRPHVPGMWKPYIEVTVPDSIRFDNATVIFTGEYPTSFLAAYLPPSATYTFALTNAWSEPAERELNRMVRERIAKDDGPFVAVMVDIGDKDGPQAIDTLLAGLRDRFGLTTERSRCARFRTSVDTAGGYWLACPLSRLPDGAA